MLQIVVNVGVPVGLFVLMLVAGTEVRPANLRTALEQPRLLLLGSLGQLVLLPLAALLIGHAVSPSGIIAACLVLLAVSPGGGISNYYCYFGRLNVASSAAITFVGTLLSLLTIPIFMQIAPALEGQAMAFNAVPAGQIVMQLLVLMILPMIIGAMARQKFSAAVEMYGTRLRTFSNLLVLLVLVLTVWAARSSLFAHLYAFAVFAVLFIFAAMLIGWLLGRGLSSDSQSVLVIEAGTRNVGVALLLGSEVLAPEAFPILAGFLSVYFLAEVLIMLNYAGQQARRRGGTGPMSNELQH